MSPPNLGEIQPANIRCRGLRHSGTSNEAASCRLFACVEALPPDQAVPLWREAQAQATAHL